MAERKSDEQKLQELEKRMEQLKAQRKAIVARESKKARAERTRRLIQNGALAEKYLDRENIEPAEFENLLKKLVAISEVKSMIKDR
jgi:predicted metalloendopeptidase